jgi:hypothetical protein
VSFGRQWLDWATVGAALFVLAAAALHDSPVPMVLWFVGGIVTAISTARDQGKKWRAELAAMDEVLTERYARNAEDDGSTS